MRYRSIRGSPPVSAAKPLLRSARAAFQHCSYPKRAASSLQPASPCAVAECLHIDPSDSLPAKISGLTPWQSILVLHSNLSYFLLLPRYPSGLSELLRTKESGRTR